MPSDGKTALQRDILLTWYNNPNATNKEIAKRCDCSASYVSQVKNRFDDYNEMEAMMDRQDREMEQMFGDDIFSSGDPIGGGGDDLLASGPEKGLAEQYEDLPDNLAGNLGRVFILLILIYVLYEVVMILFM
jgi:hypothetical protein